MGFVNECHKIIYPSEERCYSISTAKGNSECMANRKPAAYTEPDHPLYQSSSGWREY